MLYMYSSLKYLSKTYKVGKCHPAVKPYELSIRDINRSPVMNKILTGTYILQTNRVKFNQNEVNPTCVMLHLKLFNILLLTVHFWNVSEIQFCLI